MLRRKLSATLHQVINRGDNARRVTSDNAARRDIRSHYGSRTDDRASSHSDTHQYNGSVSNETVVLYDNGFGRRSADPQGAICGCVMPQDGTVDQYEILADEDWILSPSAKDNVSIQMCVLTN